jgi:putative N6-adenine-specific DNA methylase
VAEYIEFSCKAISAISPPPGPGWVITNPPYGVRLGNTADLRNLYAQLGKILRARCPDWQVTLLCGSRPLIRSVGLKINEEISLVNSGLKVTLVKGQVP